MGASSWRAGQVARGGSLWQPDAGPRERQRLAVPGPEASAPVLDHEFTGTEWVSLDGQKHVAVRRPIPNSDWSLVVFKKERTQVANRLLGIVITLLLCAVVLTYFVAMQRQLGAESYITGKRREAEGRAREMARRADTDALTGVLNRMGFNEAMVPGVGRARRYQQPLSVAILDIDHFKKVNDEFGHPVGDQVLVRTAKLLSSCVRDSDTVARWGGEEFAVIAPMTTGGRGGQPGGEAPLLHGGHPPRAEGARHGELRGGASSGRTTRSRPCSSVRTRRCTGRSSRGGTGYVVPGWARGMARRRPRPPRRRRRTRMGSMSPLPPPTLRAAVLALLLAPAAACRRDPLRCLAARRTSGPPARRPPAPLRLHAPGRREAGAALPGERAGRHPAGVRNRRGRVDARDDADAG